MRFPAMTNEKTQVPLTAEREEVDEWTQHKLLDGVQTRLAGVHRILFSAPTTAFSLLPGQCSTLEKTDKRADPSPPSVDMPSADHRPSLDTSPHAPLASLKWLFGQLYELGPVSYASLLSLDLLLNLHPAIVGYFNHKVLNMIEQGYVTKQMDTRAIAVAFGLETALSLAHVSLTRLRMNFEGRMEGRAELHFKYLATRARLAREYARAADEDAGEEPPDMWQTTKLLLRYTGTALSAVSQTIFLYRLLSSIEGSAWVAPALLAIWGLRALPVANGQLQLWLNGFVSHVVNPDFLRFVAVDELATQKEYKQEVSGLNLGEHILQTYQRSQSLLSGTDARRQPFHVIMAPDRGIILTWLTNMVDQIPTMYYIFCALFGWAAFSFATISAVQRTSSELRWPYLQLFGGGQESLPQTLRDIHSFYLSVQLPPDPDATREPYPPQAEEACDPAGMAVEFKNVTFSYPASKGTAPAIRDLSFSIAPGQLVVIVGPNGVGKSTLVKLLTRLFEPTSGTVLVDGQDAKSYRLKDLREASAVLSQEHQVLGGVSVAEGVGLGRWQHKDDRALVDEALRLGGAQGLVRKLAKGSDTILRPAQTKMEMGVRPGHDLWPIYEQLEKEAEVSGGEKQRLVAARTFMRINTSAVRMVVVDEPSSAMDPAGEYELFKRLREARSGKTMIFITHRFGHLTKHADMILCMKDGRLVEQGTHAELVAKKGEYYDLYNVQAQAFTTPGDA